MKDIATFRYLSTGNNIFLIYLSHSIGVKERIISKITSITFNNSTIYLYLSLIDKYRDRLKRVLGDRPCPFPDCISISISDEYKDMTYIPYSLVGDDMLLIFTSYEEMERSYSPNLIFKPFDLLDIEDTVYSIDLTNYKNLNFHVCEINEFNIYICPLLDNHLPMISFNKDSLRSKKYGHSIKLYKYINGGKFIFFTTEELRDNFILTML
jgi:hypothetical protein